MKTIRTLLFFGTMLLSLSTTAQTEHLKFLGIPLDGTLKDFHKVLVRNVPDVRDAGLFSTNKKVHFEKFSAKLGLQNYKLTLFGRDNHILANANPRTNKVYQISTCFVPAIEKESVAKEVWDKLTTQLMETYGKDKSLVKQSQEKIDNWQTLEFTVLGTDGQEIGTIKAEYREITNTSETSIGSFSGSSSSFGVGTSSSLGMLGGSIGFSGGSGTTSGTGISTKTADTTTEYYIGLFYTDKANAPQDASAGL